MPQFPLLRKDFNIAKNGNVASSLSIAAIILFGSMFLAMVCFIIFPPAAIVLLPIHFIATMLYQKRIRLAIDDMPKDKDIIGTLDIGYENITAEDRVMPMEEISECVVFYSNYQLAREGRNGLSNGNAGLFLKLKDNTTAFYRFNILSETLYKNLEKWIEHSKRDLDYLKTYSTLDYNYILNDSLTDRRRFN